MEGYYVDGLEQGEWKWYYKSGELSRTENKEKKRNIINQEN